ncbi:hypothetical protein EXN66_Car019008 [Channa argus]|uniref:Uncharacterized protein n=1 Tax=Channa argus TaxID=215402 RepID=A0A6G1QKU1_CHAAH|nr:hypothetical protein EXN66_Car019008 [Channa argus]
MCNLSCKHDKLLASRLRLVSQATSIKLLPLLQIVASNFRLSGAWTEKKA